MSDVVDELKRMAGSMAYAVRFPTLKKAADELVSLRAENERLHSTLEESDNYKSFLDLRARVERLKREKAKAIKVLRSQYDGINEIRASPDDWLEYCHWYLSALDAPSKPVWKSGSPPICPDCHNPEDECTCRAVSARLSKPVCETCGGSKEVWDDDYQPGGMDLEQHSKPCPDCNGTGEAPESETHDHESGTVAAKKGESDGEA
jgi:hypothetical protein